jgi:hypothetical protein
MEGTRPTCVRCGETNPEPRDGRASWCNASADAQHDPFLSLHLDQPRWNYGMRTSITFLVQRPLVTRARPRREYPAKVRCATQVNNQQRTTLE